MGKIKYNFIIILQHFHETPSCMYVLMHIPYIHPHIHTNYLRTVCITKCIIINKKMRRSITNDQLVDIIVINNFLVFTRNL